MYVGTVSLIFLVNNKLKNIISEFSIQSSNRIPQHVDTPPMVEAALSKVVVEDSLVSLVSLLASTSALVGLMILFL